MKICHIIYTPRLSGAEILVRDLALKHTSLGHQVAVLSIEASETSFVNELERLKSSGVLLEIPQSKLGKFTRLQFLSTKLQKLYPDVVVAHSVIPSAYARFALKLISLGHIPVVSVLHDASQDDYASKYFRLLEKWLIPSPNCLIALTQRAVDNYQLRIGNQIKTEIIPNGVNVEILSHAYVSRKKVRQTIFCVKDNEAVFLQVGRLNSIKQQHLSLESFIKSCQNSSFLGKLFFVGLLEDAEFEQSLKKSVLEAGLEDRIIFLGSRTDVPELLAGADVFLMPSKQEAHSIAFIEALASGITIIASDIPPFQYGLNFPGVSLIQPENIDSFAQEVFKASHLQIGKRWERNLDDYSINKTANEYLKIFKYFNNYSK